MHSDLEHQGIARWLGVAPDYTGSSHRDAAPYAWKEFRRRSVQRQMTQRRRQRWIAGAAAASVGILAMMISLWHHSSDVGREVSERSSKASQDIEARAAEQWLASLPSDPVVVRVGSRAAVSGLEDRIAELDDILTAARVEGVRPVRLDALQEQRARLLKSLVQVRYAEELAR